MVLFTLQLYTRNCVLYKKILRKKKSSKIIQSWYWSLIFEILFSKRHLIHPLYSILVCQAILILSFICQCKKKHDSCEWCIHIRFTRGTVDWVCCLNKPSLWFCLQFEEIFVELKENFEDLLAFNHLRVITSLAKAACQLKTCQMKLVKVRSAQD